MKNVGYIILSVKLVKTKCASKNSFTNGKELSFYDKKSRIILFTKMEACLKSIFFPGHLISSFQLLKFRFGLS